MSLSNKQPASVSNRWLSNLIRPRASSFSVESCLNLTDVDPSTPLDARPVLPLLSDGQPLQVRCRHLKALSELCKNYKFSHLENIFFAAQDILEDPMPRDARHTVFEFMLACIHGQYDDLGMARVTFYSALKSREHWEDFVDMYNVLYALCKGGRDISGFEKNIAKLLMTWIDMALSRASGPSPKSVPIDYLSDILQLLTLTGKFNFAMFEETEVADMIKAVRRAFQLSHHPKDIQACLTFTDVVVRYRFVPFEALKTFLEILCESTVLPEEVLPTGPLSVWSIFMNLLRSHCAHSSILTLCKFLDSPANPVLAQGAIQLLSEAAWGQKARTGAETYMVSDTVLLMYLRRATLQQNGLMCASVLSSLILLIENPENKLGLLDWEVIWDCIDNCTEYVLKLDSPLKDMLEYPVVDENADRLDPIYQFVRFISRIHGQFATKRYLGPVARFMKTLYIIRHVVSENLAGILLTYYETEHVLLPSAENWLSLLLDVIETFLVPITVSHVIRERTLLIVKHVYESARDFYPEEMYTKVIIPMMTKMAHELDTDIRQGAVDLLVDALHDCRDKACFDTMLELLGECARCKCFREPKTQVQSLKEDAALAGLRRSHSQSHPTTHRLHSPLIPLPRSTSVSPAVSPMIPFSKQEQTACMGLSAMNGLITIFERLLYGESEACEKVFKVITESANGSDDAMCPSGGVKLMALDLLLRLRCPPNHRIYVIQEDDLNDPTAIMVRRERERRKPEEKSGRMLGPAIIQAPVKMQPSPTVLSHVDEHTDPNTGIALPIDEALKAYIKVISQSSDWEIVLFVLKRLPIQLANKHLFCGATLQIHKLRRAVVKWISTRKFLENVSALPPTVKRNDLNRYAYDILTILVSYRRVFSKQDQDEIVYAFYIGITHVTASTKPCINALNLCCHELPLSIAKMINEILQKMSQIISVSSVSLHILEFLSALARLPNLYSNFTSDMYKPVFAIALNYLQYSHTVTQSQSVTSTPANSPMIGSPLPVSAPSTPLQSKEPQQHQSAMAQYVLIMAYLVITIWFTAMPLRERRKHVPFIIQRLLGGNPLGRPIDEQTFTCIDMLSRFSFSDVSLSPTKSLVSKVLIGESSGTKNSRTWVYGHTLLTLKTAKVTGWVEVTIRRPSGTFSMMCNIENKIKTDQVDYKTLPALLMMQCQPDIESRPLDEGWKSKLDEDALGITFEDTRDEDPKTTPTQPHSRRQSEQTAANHSLPLSRSGSASMGPVQEPESMMASPDFSYRRGSVSQKTLGDNGSTSSRPPHADKEPVLFQSEAEERRGLMIKEIMSDPQSSSHPVNNLRKADQLLDPGLVYLQLYNYPDITRLVEAPPPLPDDDATLRTLATLDRIPVVDFHKVGVLYVGPGQNHEVDILANTIGSPDYIKFLHGLGTIERLRGKAGNTGGLDREMDIDGRHAYFWKDDVTEMIFHVATMMPTNLERDPQCSAKKRHIGNDYVSIVYNDSGADYAFNTLPGQFNFVNIVVSPHSISTETMATQALWGAENSFFRVELQRRPDMPDIGPITEPKLISAHSLPGFVRQVALHANIFAQVQSGANGKREYVAHWRERLRHIRRVRDRATGNTSAPTTPSASSTKPKEGISLEALLDFTRYT
ncbi:hypothetical protein CLU79DRAFT_761716 [Phycomyces nitens]|nr:hypothetical protein CLU79DRAFT_761716 [Phycomyces nitens]